MTRAPRVIHGNPLAYEVLPLFGHAPNAQLGGRHAGPGELPVVDDDGRPVGMLMLKDLLRAGIV
jgi:arabinose-5-phosphate isomerase